MQNVKKKNMRLVLAYGGHIVTKIHREKNTHIHPSNKQTYSGALYGTVMSYCAFLFIFTRLKDSR